MVPHRSNQSSTEINFRHLYMLKASAVCLYLTCNLSTPKTQLLSSKLHFRWYFWPQQHH